MTIEEEGMMDQEARPAIFYWSLSWKMNVISSCQDNLVGSVLSG